VNKLQQTPDTARNLAAADPVPGRPGLRRPGYLTLSCIAIACSTSEMSADLVDFLSLASHCTIGTCGLTDSAS
jgi:hypothetical protein